MGRHSAPADDEDERAPAPVLTTIDGSAAVQLGRHSDAPAGVDDTTQRPLSPQGTGSLPVAGRTAISTRPGPRLRPVSAAPSAVTGPVPRVPPELPVERTLAISAVQAEIAADIDAADAPVLDTVSVSELDPIRPGEAVVPPSDEGINALQDLLVEPAPNVQPTAKPEPGAVVALIGSAMDKLRRPRPKSDADADADADQITSDSHPPALLRSEVVPAINAVDIDVAATATTPGDDVPTADTTVAERRGSAADLAMLRSDHSLLARCLAGVLVPFLAYVIVMVVLDAGGRRWLIWIWLPAIAAGVLAGMFLDIAHKHRRRPAEVDVSRA